MASPRIPSDSHSSPSDPAPLAVPTGTVVPYDMVLDRELRRFSQDGYGFDQLDLLMTRTRFEPLAVTVEQARKISRPKLIVDAVRSVATAGPAGYIYACTSGSFIRGLAGERRLTESIQRAGRDATSAVDYAVDTAWGHEAVAPVSGRIPTAVTTSGALLEAVTALGATTIAAATPYDEAVGALFGTFFAEAGIELVNTAHLGLRRRIWAVPWDEIFELARQADTSDADVVVVSCTNLPTYEVLEHLEQQLGKPVISANQATVWAALRRSGRSYFGPGSALRELTPATEATVTQSGGVSL